MGIMGVMDIRVISIYWCVPWFNISDISPVAISSTEYVKPKGLAWPRDIFSPLQHIYKYSLEGSARSSNLSRSVVGGCWTKRLCKCMRVLFSTYEWNPGAFTSLVQFLRQDTEITPRIKTNGSRAALPSCQSFFHTIFTEWVWINGTEICEEPDGSPNSRQTKWCDSTVSST